MFALLWLNDRTAHRPCNLVEASYSSRAIELCACALARILKGENQAAEEKTSIASKQNVGRSQQFSEVNNDE